MSRKTFNIRINLLKAANYFWRHSASHCVKCGVWGKPRHHRISSICEAYAVLRINRSVHQH